MGFVAMRMRFTLGFSLLEVTLALAISAVLIAVAVKAQARQQENNLVQAEAAQLTVLATALQDYIDTYKPIIIKQQQGIAYPQGRLDEMGQDQLPAGMAPGHTAHPSLEQLKALGLLPADFSAQSLIHTGSYQTARIHASTSSDASVDLSQANHACLQNACTLRLLAHADVPMSSETEALWITTTGKPLDDRMTGMLLDALRTQSGITGVVSQTTGSVAGGTGSETQSNMVTASEQVLMPNPLVAQTPGILGVVAQALYLPPVANADYCPSGWWKFTADASASGAITAEQVSSLEAAHCVAPHADIPLGLQAVATDYRGSLRGHVRLLCKVTETGTLSLIDARSSGDAARSSDARCSTD